MKWKLPIYLMLMLLFFSCKKLIDKDKSNHYYYNWNKSKIIYNDHRTWNYSCEVNCDLKTFKVIKGLWAKDKNFIIYDGKARPKIDLKTFYFDKKGLPKDSKYVYTLNWSGNGDDMLVWENANPKTFELIKVPEQVNTEMWGKDDKNYFIMLRVVNCDYKTFVIINESYAKDKDNVYYDGKIITGADPFTFKFDSLKRVFKDKNFEYFAGKKK